MTLFRNGHKFTFCVRCGPPAEHVLPFIYAQMAGPGGAPMPVIGKVDTGASRTVLNFDTAGTATDAPFDYYVHQVLVTVVDEQENSVFFPLKAAFAEKVKRNLFGVDWLDHVCLAVDREAVHLLRD